MGVAGRFYRSFCALGRGHVTFDENAANVFRHGFALLFLKIKNGNLAASSGKRPSGPFAKAGCTTGNNGRYVLEFHNPLLLVSCSGFFDA
jgi:hypothetical protein